jgi:hypothetical protein
MARRLDLGYLEADVAAYKLERVVPPALPSAGIDYTPGAQEQLNNVQRLFYNRLTQSYNNLIDTDQGDRGLYFPYGSFYDTTDQTAASTTVAYPVNMNATDLSAGVTVASSNQITFQYPGIYVINFAIQLSNNSNAPQDIDLWFRKNGSDLTNSNTRYGLPARKSVGDPFHLVANMGFPVQVAADDYVQIMWCTTNVSAQIEYYAAGASPTRPAIPSVITWVTFLSAVVV